MICMLYKTVARKVAQLRFIIQGFPCFQPCLIHNSNRLTFSTVLNPSKSYTASMKSFQVIIFGVWFANWSNLTNVYAKSVIFSCWLYSRQCNTSMSVLSSSYSTAVCYYSNWTMQQFFFGCKSRIQNLKCITLFTDSLHHIAIKLMESVINISITIA